MKNVIKKAIAFLVVFILVIPMFNREAFAMDDEPVQDASQLLGTTKKDVAYLEYDGPGSYWTWFHDCEVLTSDNDDWEGWLVAYGDITISKRVVVNESVHLILADDCTLTCQEGIEVETSWTPGKDDAELTIYAQSTGENMGRLIATANADRAGIGSGSCLIDLDGDISGTIYIHGGYIEAVGGSFGAGIGGGNAASGADVTIYGGEVHAQGGLQSAGIGGGAEGSTGSGGEGGNLTVYGGIVEAIGYRNESDKRGGGAGIGGGNDGDGGTVTIYDGTVTAIGGFLAAGIGGGHGGKGGRLTVYGGSVTATGGECINHSLLADKFGGAGIGGGSEKDGGTVTIYNGTVTATGIDGGAGIGGGGGSLESADSKAGGDGGTVTVYNGTITATGNDGGAGIGGGSRANGGTITLYGGTFDIKNNFNKGKALGRGYGGGSDGSIDVGVGSSVFDVDGTRINGGFNPKSWGACGYFFDDNLIKQFSVRTYGNPVTYHAYDLVYGEGQYECRNYTFINKNVKKWENGWYVVDDGGTIEDVVTVTGDVHLIIEDGEILVAKKGIRVEKGASLSVHAQSDGENQGCLIVYGTNYCAGIGGGDGKAGGAFTLHSGEVVVYGGNSAAGIGGGRNGNGGSFTIYGGKLTVSSGAGASRAIGAGNGASDNGTVTVRESFNLYDADSKKTISKDSDSTSWASLLTEPNYTLMLVRKEFVPGEPVSYLYYDNNLKLQSAECKEYTCINKDTKVMENGWYVVNEDITMYDTISVFGDVRLILLNGKTFNAYGGVCVNDGNSLTVYAQSEWENEMGVLNACGYYDYKNAGIGGAVGRSGGNITIDGGKISAVGLCEAAGIGGGSGGKNGNVVIHGGIVAAESMEGGAGIGTGMYECTYSTDNDGKVELTEYGHNDGNITITGGIVKASTSSYGSGIGGGEGFEGGNITISGGTVTSNGWNSGIGSGCFRIRGVEFYDIGEIPGGDVNITGGDIIAESILITGKAFLTEKLLISENTSVFVYNDDVRVLVEDPADYVSECKRRKKVELLGIHEHDFYGKYRDNGDGTHSRKCSICSKFIPEKHNYDEDGVCSLCGSSLPEYYEYDVGTQSFVRKLMEDVPKKITSAKNGVTLPGGWYLIEGDVTIDGSLNFTDDAHIVLKDGCILKVKNGIVGESGANLSFYAQSPASANPGKVIVPANDCANAGIGAREKDRCGKITIHGGDFDVHGGLGAAGIGGSRNGSCGKITIYSGKINATGRATPNGAGGGAGIGSGYYVNVKYDGVRFIDYGITDIIEINGGDITAEGGRNAAGIGGGAGSAAGEVVLNGGVVHAYGGENAVGIGNGWYDYVEVFRVTHIEVAVGLFKFVKSGGVVYDNESKPVITGDESNSLIWIVLCILSLMVLGGAMIIQRKMCGVNKCE